MGHKICSSEVLASTGAEGLKCCTKSCTIISYYQHRRLTLLLKRPANIFWTYLFFKHREKISVQHRLSNIRQKELFCLIWIVEPISVLLQQRKAMNLPLLNGIVTGLFLQLAIGPVFFYVVNLALQKTLWNGLAGVMGVTFVDYLYIMLAILGVGKLLEGKKARHFFKLISSIILIVFGAMIIHGIVKGRATVDTIGFADLWSSFSSVALLTLSNPMTIVFFVGLFAAKAVDHGYAKKELFFFGLGAGLATFLFMGCAVLLFSAIKSSVPIWLIQSMNLVVGLLLVGYGCWEFIKFCRTWDKIDYFV